MYLPLAAFFFVECNCITVHLVLDMFQEMEKVRASLHIDGLGRVAVPDLPSACAMLGSMALGRRGAVWRVLGDRAVRVASLEAIGD